MHVRVHADTNRAAILDPTATGDVAQKHPSTNACTQRTRPQVSPHHQRHFLYHHRFYNPSKHKRSFFTFMLYLVRVSNKVRHEFAFFRYSHSLAHNSLARPESCVCQLMQSPGFDGGSTNFLRDGCEVYRNDAGRDRTRTRRQ